MNTKLTIEEIKSIYYSFGITDIRDDELMDDANIANEYANAKKTARDYVYGWANDLACERGRDLIAMDSFLFESGRL